MPCGFYATFNISGEGVGGGGGGGGSFIFYQVICICKMGVGGGKMTIYTTVIEGGGEWYGFRV